MNEAIRLSDAFLQHIIVLNFQYFKNQSYAYRLQSLGYYRDYEIYLFLQQYDQNSINTIYGVSTILKLC